ncbi:hypothetical protein BCR44DRAFT_1433945 [Catenaria anguillulae PL171]|uniref:Uncharacterized protein n=1 Tax=Catenaria anguillulae PL171 TaxID=765915 RepID=A0A1Y2HM66_9FUNG|nr:hypothetical protein BCR44DRAFT_1433945 [Catenaria anguillulae PL171]
MATTPTLPSSATFTSLPMPPTRSPPFSPSTSSRPIVSNPSATWELAEFLSTTEPPTALSATSPASVSSKSSKSSRSSGFFGKKFASSKSQPTLSASSPSPPPPVPTSVVPERLPPGHPKYVMLPGADQVLRQFGGGQSDTPSGPTTPIPQARRRSQAKPSEPDPASSTVSTSMAAAMPPVPSPPPPASSAFRRSHSPGHMSTVSATLPEGSSVAARMRATLAAAMADADAATNAKLQRVMMRAVSPSSGRKYATSPVPAGAVGESLAQSQSGGEEARGRNVGGVGDEQRAPRRSSSVTRDRPVTVLGPRGVSPVRVPVQKTSRGVSPVRQQVVSVDEPTYSSAPPGTAAMVAPAAEPTPTPTPTLTTSRTVPPAPPSPLPTLPPLPDSLSDLSRADLERLVRLLHADATAARHVADDARAAEAAHKAQLDKLAVRAFKTITDLRKRDVERDAEMEAVKREREEVGTRLGQVLAVLGGVVPGLVPEEVAGEGVVRSQS